MPILIIRHGNTTFDSKVDALLDPPLNEEGSERIKRTIKFVKGQNYKIIRIVSSPLQRALKVAEMLSDGNIKVTTHNAALPWNLGDLQGRQSKVAEPVIERLKDYPDLKPPHGETYRTFYTRWSDFLENLMTYMAGRPDETLVVTTHSRNVNALQSILGGNPIGDVMETAPEGSVTILAKNGVSNWQYDLVWEGN